MPKTFVKILFYLTLIEAVVAFVFIFIHIQDNSLELGALVLAFLDAAGVIYYILLATAINILVKKDVSAYIILVVWLLFNSLPVFLYFGA